MPYIVEAGGPDKRSVAKEFSPRMSFEQRVLVQEPGQLSEANRKSLPSVLLVEKPIEGGVPGILGWSTGRFIVCREVRDFINSHEPFAQEFLPIKVLSKDDRPIQNKIDHGEYYLALNPPSLNCVVIEETDFIGGHGYAGIAGGRTAISTAANKNCTLDAGLIAGYHFWRASEPFEYTYFCSDELHNFIVEQEIEGLIFSPKCKMRMGVIPP